MLTLGHDLANYTHWMVIEQSDKSVGVISKGWQQATPNDSSKRIQELCRLKGIGQTTMKRSWWTTSESAPPPSRRV